MKRRHVLVCAPRVPEYDRECGSARIYDFLLFLRRAGWAVSFLAENAAGGACYVRQLRQAGVIVYAGPQTHWATDDYVSDYAALLRSQHFDLAIIHFWHLAEQLLPLVRRWSPQTRIIVDTVDLHLLRLMRRELRPGQAARSTGGLNGRHGDEIVRELNVYAAADLVLTVSQKEADLINDFVSRPGHAQVVALAEELASSALSVGERRGMVFIGNFRHPPNHEAIRFLVRDVLPLLPAELLAEHPVSVVGNGLDAAVLQDCAHPAVRPVGWVPTITPYLATARISLVPLLTGAGTKCKLIQSLMIGTPTVATPIGVEGMALRDGVDVLVAADAAGFAAAVVRLMCNDALWAELQVQGRAAAVQAHHRPQVAARLIELVETIVAAPHALQRQGAVS